MPGSQGDEQDRSHLKLQRKSSISKMMRNAKKQEKFIEQPEFLLEPQEITREMKFSTDLTNLCASTRTQDMGANKNLLDKLNSIDEPSICKKPPKMVHEHRG